jgi:bifunctional DNA-binding transcriptional regulator/antitoxin component of YhaV-PrlF toxin-antitoxin module
MTATANHSDLKLSYLSRIDKSGRIVLRKAMRDAMGMPDGGPVTFHTDESGALIISPAKTEK